MELSFAGPRMNHVLKVKHPELEILTQVDPGAVEVDAVADEEKAPGLVLQPGQWQKGTDRGGPC